MTRLFRVAQDPGHGERGDGAQCAGLSEVELADGMAVRVDRLCAAGNGIASRIIRGRPGDDWAKLDGMAKHHGAELVVNHHLNASTHGQRGVLAFYHPANRQGLVIAETMVEAVRAACPRLISKSSGAYPCDHPGYPRAATVVGGFTATTVLVEYYFVTSDHDRHEASRPYTHDLLAAAIYTGIVRGAQLSFRGTPHG